MTDAVAISAWYGGGRTRATMVRPPGPGDEERWRHDVQRIAATGIPNIRCWVDWASAEPEPGAFDTRALDLLLDLADDAGLGVYVQLYLDSAPDWLGRRFADARYVSDGDVPIDSQGSPGYCYDHPGVREAAERLMHRLASHLADRPAFRGWDLWSEPHVVQWGYFDFLVEPASFCYCPHTQGRFREWLQKRYDSLDAVNAAWYRTFSAWDDVGPPRFTTLMTSASSVDWQRFLQDKLAANLAWRHDAIRRADTHVTSSHSAMPCLLTLPTSDHGSPDDWRMPASVDVYGTSLYPKHLGAAETADPAFRSALLAATHSACGGPFWLGELQGGHGYVKTFAKPVTGDDVRSYAWQAIAHGAKGLHFYAWYPMTTGIESGGFGLADLSGEPTERAHAAGEVARVTGAHPQLFADARPWPAKTAICWDVHANALWAAMGETWHYVPSRSYVGCYTALFGARLPADYVHPDRLVTDGYHVVYLPFAIALPQHAADAVGEFVRDGGIAVAEARTGWTDDTGSCGEAIPGLGLDAVFGARERDTERLGSTEAPERVPMRVARTHPLLPGLGVGDEIGGALFRQRLEPADDADVLAVFDDGSPALVAHRHGAGWAVLAGSLVSLAAHTLGDDGARRFLAGVADAAAVRPPVTADVPEVEARLLTEGDDVLLIALNHGDLDVRPAFTFERPYGRASDLVRDQDVSVHRDGNRTVVSRPLGPAEVAILHLRESR